MLSSAAEILWQFCGNSLHKLPQIGPNRTFRETRPASLLTRSNGIEFNYLDGQWSTVLERQESRVRRFSIFKPGFDSR